MNEQLEIRATQFNKEEMNRILSVLSETDPRSRDYVQVLDSFERFLYFGNVIAAAQDLVLGGIQEPLPYGVGVKQPAPVEEKTDNIIQFNPPTTEAVMYESTTSSAQIADVGVKDSDVTYEPAVVKKAIQDARMQGKLSSAKDWIKQEFDVDGFSAIPASRYGEVMTKLKELA